MRGTFTANKWNKALQVKRLKQIVFVLASDERAPNAHFWVGKIDGNYGIGDPKLLSRDLVRTNDLCGKANCRFVSVSKNSKTKLTIEQIFKSFSVVFESCFKPKKDWYNGTELGRKFWHRIEICQRNVAIASKKKQKKNHRHYCKIELHEI